MSTGNKIKITQIGSVIDQKENAKRFDCPLGIFLLIDDAANLCNLDFVSR